MPRIKLPKAIGQISILESRAGSPLIVNNQGGKNKISIPCRDWEHAEQIVEKIKSSKSGSEIWI